MDHELAFMAVVVSIGTGFLIHGMARFLNDYLRGRTTPHGMGTEQRRAHDRGGEVGGREG